ncbi:MAG: SPOR domain-containing protein [Nitrospiria bacterium]
MNAISQISHNFSPQSGFAPNRQEMMGAPFSNTQLQIQKSSAFTLFTAEGDRVSLSTFSSIEASVSTYNHMGEVQGAGESTDISLSKTFAMSLSMEGEFNAEELKDLKKALKAIEKLSKDFFKGKPEKALDRAERVSGLSTIASFEAVLHYQKNLSVEQTVTDTAPALSEPVAQPPASPAPAPSTEPSPAALPVPAKPEATPTPGPILPDAENSPPATPVSTPPASTPQAEPNIRVTAFAAKITEVIEKSNVEPKKIMKPLNKFMDRLFEKLGHKDHHKDGLGFKDLKLARAVQSQVMLNLSKHPEVEGEGPAHKEGMNSSHAHEPHHD